MEGPLTWGEGPTETEHFTQKDKQDSQGMATETFLPGEE